MRRARTRLPFRKGNGRMQRLLATMTATITLIACSVRESQSREPTADDVRSSIRKSLPLLEKGSIGSADNRTCFTCHSQALPVFALTEAKRRGFDIDEENLERQIKHAAAHLERGKARYVEGRGQGGGVDTAGYALWTLEAGGGEPDETTAVVTEYLLKKFQTKEKHWKRTGKRPPTEASEYTTTYLALRGLSVFGTPDQQERIAEQTTSVAAWLKDASPKETEDRVFFLRALEYTDVDSQIAKTAVDELIQMQREDGGWAQKTDMKSDAYATGTVLVALERSGLVSPSDEVYRRGLRYLLKTQLDDGSWRVKTRSKPIQTYFETGFPHEKDQFISTFATGWATVALLLTLPEKAAP